MNENPNENPKQRMTRHDVYNMFPNAHGKHAWTWLDYLCARHAVSMGAPVDMALSTTAENAIAYLRNMNELIDKGFITREFVLATAALVAHCNEVPDFAVQYFKLREVRKIKPAVYGELLREQLTLEVT